MQARRPARPHAQHMIPYKRVASHHCPRHLPSLCTYAHVHTRCNIKAHIITFETFSPVYTMESEQTRELALRTHIRNLLLNYSLTHLATNYVTWTQDTVNEVRLLLVFPLECSSP